MAENFENDDLQNTFVVLEVRKKKVYITIIWVYIIH